MCETGRTARPASAWVAAAVEEGKDEERCAFLTALATTYLVIVLLPERNELGAGYTVASSAGDLDRS